MPMSWSLLRSRMVGEAVYVDLGHGVPQILGWSENWNTQPAPRLLTVEGPCPNPGSERPGSAKGAMRLLSAERPGSGEIQARPVGRAARKAAPERCWHHQTRRVKVHHTQGGM
jgi:hypothetical protein